MMVKNSKRKLARVTTTIAVGIALTGCLSLLPQAQNAPDIYKLTTPTNVAQKVANAPVVAVTRPMAVKALSADDIVLSPDGNRIAYAARARGSEPVPNLVQQAAIDAMVQKSGYSTVTAGSLARADYVLQINLRSFEAVFDNGEDEAPVARVQFTATLTDARERSLVGETQIFTSERAVERRVSTIVSAQRDASVEAMRNLADWVDTQIGTKS